MLYVKYVYVLDRTEFNKGPENFVKLVRIRFQIGQLLFYVSTPKILLTNDFPPYIAQFNGHHVQIKFGTGSMIKYDNCNFMHIICTIQGTVSRDGDRVYTVSTVYIG
jgi:hypothetical protein